MRSLPFSRWAVYGIFLVCFAPWLYIQPQIRIGGDAAWLIGAARQFLAGRHMTEAYYDNNPPLSYMIYAPVAFLCRLGLTVWTALTVFTLSLTACAAGLMAGLIAGWKNLDRARRDGWLAAFVAGITLPAQLEFGQKDHLIAIMLLPFLMAQYALTFRHDVPRWIVRAAVVLGVPFILLKPHYGLLPAAMLAWRAWREKRWAVLFDFDALALVAGSFLYVGAVFLWFPDFIREVLPDSLGLYVFQVRGMVFPACLGLGLLGGCLLVLAVFMGGGEARRAAVFLSGMGLLCVVPLLAQMKGFSLHMLPAESLLVPALFMTLTLEMRRMRPVLTVLGVLVLALVVFPPAFSYPRHEDYRRSPLADYVREKAAGGSFFIESNSTNIIVPVSLYTGVPVASRFPSEWFMPGIAAAGHERERQVFAEAFAQDLARFRPAFVALYAQPGAGFDLVGLFGGNADFAREWGHYAGAGEPWYFDHAAYRDPTGGGRAYVVHFRDDKKINRHSGG